MHSGMHGTNFVYSIQELLACNLVVCGYHDFFDDDVKLAMTLCGINKFVVLRNSTNLNFKHALAEHVRSTGVP